MCWAGNDSCVCPLLSCNKKAPSTTGFLPANIRPETTVFRQGGPSLARFGPSVAEEGRTPTPGLSPNQAEAERPARASLPQPAPGATPLPHSPP